GRDDFSHGGLKAFVSFGTFDARGQAVIFHLESIKAGLLLGGEVAVLGLCGFDDGAHLSDKLRALGAQFFERHGSVLSECRTKEITAGAGAPTGISPPRRDGG